MTSDKTLNRLALFSLVFGGFLLLSYVMLAYTNAWRGEFLGFRMGDRFNSTNLTDDEVNGTGNGTTFASRAPRGPVALNPAVQLVSPERLLLVISGLAFVANGVLLSRYVKRKEVKHTREFTISTMLTDEERAVFDALRKTDGSATQKALSNELGYSAVKMHRVLARLEQKKVVKSYPFGMTKKIVITDADTN